LQANPRHVIWAGSLCWGVVCTSPNT
jgi:hypothetical protein